MQKQENILISCSFVRLQTHFDVIVSHIWTGIVLFLLLPDVLLFILLLFVFFFTAHRRFFFIKLWTLYEDSWGLTLISEFSGVFFKGSSAHRLNYSKVLKSVKNNKEQTGGQNLVFCLDAFHDKKCWQHVVKIPWGGFSGESALKLRQKGVTHFSGAQSPQWFVLLCLCTHMTDMTLTVFTPEYRMSMFQRDYRRSGKEILVLWAGWVVLKVASWPHRLLCCKLTDNLENKNPKLKTLSRHGFLRLWSTLQSTRLWFEGPMLCNSMFSHNNC